MPPCSALPALTSSVRRLECLPRRPYVRIAKHVPPGAARVLEFGVGQGRNLYYYPKGTGMVVGRVHTATTHAP